VAVKIVRQPNKIALLGAPTSAAALSAGHEGGPSALRAAGLIERLKSIGYEVVDLGDDPPQLSRADQESPRARNLPAVVAALEALKPRVEHAVKSGALPLILSGDCSVALATVAGVRRYVRNVGLVYMDRDADLNTPATTSSGSVDGMVVSHLTGRGAAELVRLWGEPPLVREPDLALFGVDRLEPAEQEALSRSPLRCYLAVDIHRYGAGITAQGAVDRIHGKGSEFVLHLDVDVIADFQSTNYPGSGGLVFEEVREALNIFAKQKHLAAIEVTAYNPAKDSDRRGAQMIIDLLADALEARLSASQEEPRPSVAVAVGASSVPPDTELAQQSTTDTVIEPGAGKLGEGAELVTPLESAQNPESTKDEPAS
jgi:arginase